MNKKNSSYNQILRATSILGGSQVVNILLSVIRSKIVAILLGPVGIGLIGIYYSVLDVIRSFSGMAIETGTIKEVARVKDDKANLDKTTSILKQWFVIAAGIGALVCVIFCYPLSIWVFKDATHTLDIALLSIAAFLITISAGRFAIMQGLRKIPYLARITISGGLIGLVVIVPMYYIWGMDAIIPALILNSFLIFICTGFYFRRLSLKRVDVPAREVINRGLSILKIGLFVVLGGIVNTLSMLVVRTYISHTLDMAAVGLFQSAWAITSVYVGLIIGATGTDYFPRLSAIIDNVGESKKLINEQTYIILIITTPIVVGMLLFTSLAIYLLYSSDFVAAKDILQWQVLGTYFKILATPLAVVLLAKSKGVLYLLSEVAFFAVYLLSSYLLAPYWGISAVGIGYLLAYVVYMIVIFVMIRRILAFSWNKEILKIIATNILFISLAFYLSHTEYKYSLFAGIGVFALTIAYSFFKLKQIFSLNDIRGWFERKE